MSDLSVAKNQQFLVEPTNKVQQMWAEMKIQELQSKIMRAKQDIEDLRKGRIIGLEANILMWQMEKTKLENDITIDV